MGDIRNAAETERLDTSVFQPSKAEIAEEMKLRLELNDEDERKGRNTPAVRPEEPA